MEKITNEFLREIQTKINCKKHINDIVKCSLKNENNLTEEEQKIVTDNLNKSNIVEFYEKMVYTGGLGEFYTPKSIVDLISGLTSEYDKNNTKVYEPTIGTANLVSNFKKVNGQEFNKDTYELVKLLYPDFNVKQGETLKDDKFEHEKFDLIISNPPYGGKGWESFEHEKFKPCTVPKKAIETAFVQHNIFHLNEKGKAIMILPHGFLFRGNKEKKVREYLMEENLIESVIGLPDKLFSNTPIPVVIVIFNKCKSDDKVLFIDASKEFEKAKNQNILTEENIKKIIETYSKREEIEKFSHLATIEEIEENDFNLNIPRYVDTFEEEEPIDIVEVSKDYAKLVEEEKQIRADLLRQLEDLNGEPEILAALKSMLEVR